MKRLLIVIGLALAVGGWSYASLQRPDLAGQLTGDVTIAPGFYANSAVTGAWIDIANYHAVALGVHTGLLEPTGTTYLVLQDSSTGLAVRALDSIGIAGTADTSYLDLNYRGERRFVRGLLRASGAAGDTNVVSVAVFGMPRAR